MKPSSQKQKPFIKKLLLISISLGYFMVLLDTTIVNIALPNIQAQLGGDLSSLQWVVNAYTIVFAGLLLSMGSFSDRWGAKRVYIWGLILFILASVTSMFAPNLHILIGLRALLGIGGAALLPASLSLLSQLFSDPKEHAKAIAAWASITGIALATGPVVGGLLVDAFDWPSIFFINIPLGLISLVVTVWFHHSSKNNKMQLGFDIGGQLTAIIVILFLSFALVEGEIYGWLSPLIIGAFFMSFLSIILFVFFESKGKHPLLPLSLFQNKTISTGMLAGLLINIGLSGILFVFPLFFQQIQHLSASQSGMYLLPMTIAMAFNPILTGKIVSKIGPRIPMFIGFLLAAIGTGLQLGIHTNSHYLWIGISLFIIGIGISLTIPSLMTAVMSAAAKEQVGVASGALNSIRQVGAVLGVAMAGAFLTGSNSFLTGLHYALLIISVILVVGGIFSISFTKRK